MHARAAHFLGVTLALAVAVCACGARTGVAERSDASVCSPVDPIPTDPSGFIIVPPVAFLPRSTSVIWQFSGLRALVISEAANACQEYTRFEQIRIADVPAHFLGIQFPPGIGTSVVGVSATGSVAHLCPGDSVTEASAVVNADSGHIDVTTYSEGVRAAGVYELHFGAVTVSGSFDTSFCDW